MLIFHLFIHLFIFMIFEVTVLGGEAVSHEVKMLDSRK